MFNTFYRQDGIGHGCGQGQQGLGRGFGGGQGKRNRRENRKHHQGDQQSCHGLGPRMRNGLNRGAGCYTSTQKKNGQINDTELNFQYSCRFDEAVRDGRGPGSNCHELVINSLREQRDQCTKSHFFCDNLLQQQHIDCIEKKSITQYCRLCRLKCHVTDLRCKRGIAWFAKFNTKDSVHA